VWPSTDRGLRFEATADAHGTTDGPGLHVNAISGGFVAQKAATDGLTVQARTKNGRQVRFVVAARRN
jgi:hypothetical protein